MSKRAVIVGINDYARQPPTKYYRWPSLNGCLADADAMRNLLNDAFGFDEITVLTDGLATSQAILDAVSAMLNAASPGDVVAFCYAGHGGRLPNNPDDQNDPANSRFYECIVPYSGAYLTDQDFYDLAQDLDQSTVNFTLIMDSCHSGGMHEDGPDTRLRSGLYSDDLAAMCVNLMDTIIPCGVVLPPDSTELTGNVSNVSGDGNGIACSVDDNKSFVAQSRSTVLAACRYDEVDADNAGGSGHGALTQALINVVDSSLPQISYHELVDALRDQMSTKLNVLQTPTLLGQFNRMDEMFLAPWTSSV